MGGQLSLDIRPRLAYAADNFVLHAGVRSLFDEASILLAREHFALSFVEGAARSGKTHFLIKLFDALRSENVYPHLLEGGRFQAFLNEATPNPPRRVKCVYLVDDADSYFLDVRPGQGGAFVRFIEDLRVCGGAVCFVSNCAVEAFPADEHVKSRLLAGSGFHLGTPQVHERSMLIRSMALQRGLKFQAARLQFLDKRLRGDVASIEEYLARVAYLHHVSGRPITQALLSDAL